MRTRFSIVTGAVVLSATAAACVAGDGGWQSTRPDHTETDVKGPTLAVPSVSQLPAQVVQLRKELAAVKAELARLNNRREPADNDDQKAGPHKHKVKTSPTRGRVIVKNYTGLRQYLEVNGFVYPIVPGENDIWVAYGVVRTRLLPHEAPIAWDVSRWRYNGRDHELPVMIAYR